MAVETISNAEEFLKQTALDVNPSGDYRAGTAVFDLLIAPMAALLQPVLDDVQDIALRQSLSLLDSSLSETDVDELMANIFVTRRGGTRATGTARLLFDQAISFLVPSGTVFRSAGGLDFIADSSQSITQAGMSLNISGDLFYFDVTVTADAEGEQYNIAANDLVDVLLTDESIVLVDNLSPFTQGVDRETNSELFARGSSSITTRDLVTKSGIKVTLLNQFEFIRDLQSAGFGDPEMIRDELTGENISIGGITLGDATEENIGGKVDIYFQVDSRVQKTVDLDPANVRNRLRSKDSIDPSASDPEVTFIIKGGLVGSVTSTNGDTDVQSDDLNLITNELAGKQVEFITGAERRSRFTVVSNTGDTVRLTGSVEAGAGDAFFVTGTITRPAIRIIQVEEIDPATKDPIGVFLTENEDFIFEVETPSVRLSDTERTSIIITELGGSVDSVSANLALNTVITDASLSMTPGSLTTQKLRMTDGEAFGEDEFTILTNTSTTITVSGDQTAKVKAGDGFVVVGGPNVGRSYRVTYETQEQVTQVQDFVEAPANRVDTGDLLSKAANSIFVDSTISVSLKASGGTLDVSALETAVEDYVQKTLGLNADLEASDIVDLLYETSSASRSDFKVKLPITINFEKRSIAGEIITGSSQDALSADRTEVFVPRSIVVSEI